MRRHRISTPRRSALEVAQLSHNALAALPPALLGIKGMRELSAGHNQLEELVGPIHLMEGLQVGPMQPVERLCGIACA